MAKVSAGLANAERVDELGAVSSGPYRVNVNISAGRCGNLLNYDGDAIIDSGSSISLIKCGNVPSELCSPLTRRS